MSTPVSTFRDLEPHERVVEAEFVGAESHCAAGIIGVAMYGLASGYGWRTRIEVDR